MHKYKFSYKADSSGEVVGIVSATSLDTAIELIAQLKRLSIQHIVELFNVERIES
jgi:3-keto-L-gulonate-6-phosphate decarboxylase